MSDIIFIAFHPIYNRLEKAHVVSGDEAYLKTEIPSMLLLVREKPEPEFRGSYTIKFLCDDFTYNFHRKNLYALDDSLKALNPHLYKLTEVLGKPYFKGERTWVWRTRDAYEFSVIWLSSNKFKVTVYDPNEGGIKGKNYKNIDKLIKAAKEFNNRDGYLPSAAPAI